MKSIKKVERVCLSVLSLNDVDFGAVELMAKEQSEYMHPLRHAHVAKLNRLGEHNLKVINSLKELQLLLKESELLAK